MYVTHVYDWFICDTTFICETWLIHRWHTTFLCETLMCMSRDVCHSCVWVMMHMCMSHGTHVNESYHTYINESCHTCVWVMMHICMSHSTRAYESWCSHPLTLRNSGWIQRDLRHTATYCNTLQQTATHCSTLATHCNTLQHTATHCNTIYFSDTFPNDNASSIALTPVVTVSEPCVAVCCSVL